MATVEPSCSCFDWLRLRARLLCLLVVLLESSCSVDCKKRTHTTCQVSQQQWQWQRQQAIAELLSCGLAPRGHIECVYARRLTSPDSCSTIHTKHLSPATSLRPKLAESPYCLSLRKLWSVPSAFVACLMHNKNRCFACCAAEERVPKHDLWLICCQSSLDSLSIVFDWPAASLPGCLTALLLVAASNRYHIFLALCRFMACYDFVLQLAAQKARCLFSSIVVWSVDLLQVSYIYVYIEQWGAPINFEQRIKLVTTVQLSWH